jgi:hypothetical protein
MTAVSDFQINREAHIIGNEIDRMDHIIVHQFIPMNILVPITAKSGLTKPIRIYFPNETLNMFKYNGSGYFGHTDASF